MSETRGKLSTAFGRGGVGALIGAVIGGGGGMLLALFTAGTGALGWYKAQPADWWIVSGFCAIVFVLIAVFIVAAVGAVVCGLLGGVASALFSGGARH